MYTYARKNGTHAQVNIYDDVRKVEDDVIGHCLATREFRIMLASYKAFVSYT